MHASAMLDRIRGRNRPDYSHNRHPSPPKEEDTKAEGLSVNISISIRPHQTKIEMKLESSSFNNVLPPNHGSDDDDASPVIAENELLELYDSCRKLNIDGGGRLSTSSCDPDIQHRLPISEEHAHPCKDTYTYIPPSPPTHWPQRPILLRPSPESGMKIRGVRYSSSQTYLPLPGTGYCNGCTLPINNGCEEEGNCLVIDFESDLFVGTAMLRIKNVGPPLPVPQISGEETDNETSSSYFDGKKRTFQGLVRGRFKVPNIPMSECVTGQVFNHPAGHLPPRLIMKGAISIISRLAPQLQARLEGDCPRFLSPLVSTAQSAIITRQSSSSDGENNKDDDVVGKANESIESAMSEPQPSDPSSLLQELHNHATTTRGTTASSSILPPDSNCVTTRTKQRKRAFDKLHATRTKTPTFDPNSEYTFEFFQHLLLFDEFALNFVKPIGKHPLHGMLRGQPLKFMAAHQKIQQKSSGKKKIVVVEEQEKMSWLWSFDLWHESLYEDAKFHNEEQQ